MSALTVGGMDIFPYTPIVMMVMMMVVVVKGKGLSRGGQLCHGLARA